MLKIHSFLPAVSLSSCLFVTFICAIQVTKHYNGENETFFVKCGLIADHFTSLGRMRTKAAIAAFYGSTAEGVDAQKMEMYRIQRCTEGGAGDAQKMEMHQRWRCTEGGDAPKVEMHLRW